MNSTCLHNDKKDVLFLDLSNACTLLSIFLLLLLFCAGSFFSLVETALDSCHRGKLERLAEEGDVDARAVLHLLERPENSLSLSQAGITGTGILIGLLTGRFLAPFLTGILSFVPHADLLVFLVCVILITALALLLCEFLPKAIAMQNPERILMKYHALISRAMHIAHPFIRVLTCIAGFLLLLLGIHPLDHDTVTEDEVKELIEQGTEDGTFEKTEQAMVDRIFHMSDQTASSLMTPRTQMLWLDLADPLSHNLRLIKENPADIYPVGRESLDDFCGVLYGRELLNAALSKKDIELTDFIRKPLFVPRAMECFRVLEKFRYTGLHEAMVLDEYGGVIGFLTMDDLINEIIGDINSTNVDTRQDSFITVGANEWLVKGLCSIDDFKERFDFEELPEEAHDHYQTIGGFLLSCFGHIPKVGESCEWNGFTFEVKKMDRARIDRICVIKKGDAI